MSLGQQVSKKTAEVKVPLFLFALLALLYFTSYMTRLNFSAAKATLIDSQVFTLTEAGIIGTALFFSYGLGQIVSGLLSDRFAPEKIVSVGLVLTSICNFIIPFFSNVILIAVVWGINGLAQAMFWPPIVRLIDRYSDKKGYTTGVWLVSIASYAATILVYILVPLEMQWANWQAAFRFASLLAIVVLVIWVVGFYMFKKKAVPVPPDQTVSEPVQPEENQLRYTGKTKRTNIFVILGSSGAFLLMVAVAMQGFMKDGIQDWLPTLFSQGFGVNATYATFSNVILPIFSIVTMTLTTVLFEKVFKNEVLEALVFFGVAIVLCVVLVLFYKSSYILMLFLCALISSCMHGINSMFTCFAPRRFQKAGKVATMSGIFNACSYCGSAVSSYGIGYIAENSGWTATLISWIVVCGIGALFCAVSIVIWNRFIKKEA